MPTIDELAPAIAASDTDALVASQGGIARKLTRAQLVAGLQPELSLSTGVLLGKASPGSGSPEQISIGSDLVLNGTTLSAVPFAIGQLQAGNVPAGGDLVAIAQEGTNVAVSYAQFANGLGALGGIDASSMIVAVNGSTETLATFAASSLPRSGGALTGPLTLATDPSTALQAATKQYVDAQVATSLPMRGGSINGTLTVGGTAQLAAVTVSQSLGVAGGITAVGALAGSALSVTGGISAGGGVSAIGTLLVGGGATIAGGVVNLPQYQVASLPPATAGALAFASNGRKPGEAAGAGSGVLVWGTASSQWLSASNGAPVQA